MTKKNKSIANCNKKNKIGTKIDRNLLLKIEGSLYGKIVSVLGQCRFNVLCFDDGKERQCVLKSSIKKNVKIELDDIVLVGTRDFDNDSKGDIIYKYNHSEIESLKNLGEIPKNISNNNEFEEEEEIPFDFSSI
jgi:initiation factor 1A